MQLLPTPLSLPLFLTLTLALSLTPLTTARYFTAGEEWDDDKPAVFDNAQRACREGPDSIYGNDDASVTKTRCYDVANGRRTVLGSPHTLEYGECYDGLQKEVRGL